MEKQTNWNKVWVPDIIKEHILREFAVLNLKENQSTLFDFFLLCFMPSSPLSPHSFSNTRYTLWVRSLHSGATSISRFVRMLTKAEMKAGASYPEKPHPQFLKICIQPSLLHGSCPVIATGPTYWDYCNAPLSSEIFLAVPWFKDAHSILICIKRNTRPRVLWSSFGKCWAI